METTEVGIETATKKDLVFRKNYDIGGTSIQVSGKEFYPQGEKIANPSKAMVFFPGWSMGESVKSGQELNQSFADISGEKTFSVTSRPEKVIPDSLYQEAEA